MAAFIETLADDTLDRIGWRLPSGKKKSTDAPSGSAKKEGAA